MSAPADAASRLCAACGLCCNGVLFHIVRLQPADSANDLRAFGLKLKRRHTGSFFHQPCPAHSGSACTIYAARPERCRLFECRQLKRVAAGEISEAAAVDRIRDVQLRVEMLGELLARAGCTESKRPLAKRCEAIADSSQDQLREQIARELSALDAILDQDFRIPADAASDVREP